MRLGDLAGDSAPRRFQRLVWADGVIMELSTSMERLALNLGADGVHVVWEK